MTIEREEGLFTRHGLKGLLCIIAVLGWIFLIVVASVFLIMLVSPVIYRIPASRIVLFILIAPLLGLPTGILWAWRRCDRCRGRLFQYGDPPTYKGYSQKRERDFRTKTFLGSYRQRAVIDLAFTGHLRCQWCGHEDGVKPEYVVQQ